MAVVNAQKIFIFLHQCFHFLLVVFEHRSPPIKFSNTSDGATQQKPANTLRQKIVLLDVMTWNGIRMVT
jgi:hypothetical protein